jgi:hypothetical protein
MFLEPWLMTNKTGSRVGLILRNFESILSYSWQLKMNDKAFWSCQNDRMQSIIDFEAIFLRLLTFCRRMRAFYVLYEHFWHVSEAKTTLLSIFFALYKWTNTNRKIVNYTLAICMYELNKLLQNIYKTLSKHLTNCR